MSLVDGLLAYWSLDEGTGTSATDATGNGNTGTFHNGGLGGPTWVAGKVGPHALSFDSSDGEYVSVSNTPFDFGASDPFSFAFWINWVVGSGGETIIGKHASTGNAQGYSVILDRDNFRIRFQILGSDGSGIINLSPIASVPPAGWHHIVAAYDGSSSASGLLIYVDGSLVTGSLVGTLTASPSNTALLQFGYSPIASWLNATLDEIGVWDRVLTSGDASELDNGGNGLPYSDFNPDVTVDLVGVAASPAVGTGTVQIQIPIHHATDGGRPFPRRSRTLVNAEGVYASPCVGRPRFKIGSIITTGGITAFSGVGASSISMDSGSPVPARRNYIIISQINTSFGGQPMPSASVGTGIGSASTEVDLYPEEITALLQ